MQDYCVTLTLLLISQHLSCVCVCVHMCACECVTRNTEGTTKQNPITSTFGKTEKTPLSPLAVNLDVPRYGGTSAMGLSLPTHHF